MTSHAFGLSTPTRGGVEEDEEEVEVIQEVHSLRFGMMSPKATKTPPKGPRTIHIGPASSASAKMAHPRSPVGFIPGSAPAVNGGTPGMGIGTQATSMYIKRTPNTGSSPTKELGGAASPAIDFEKRKLRRVHTEHRVHQALSSRKLALQRRRRLNVT